MFLPDNIDFTESKKYILSIRLTPSGFYFSIHCPFDETVFYQNTVTFNLRSDYLKNIEKLIFDYSFFSYNFKQINAIYVDDKTTIVPNEYYGKKLVPDLLSFNCNNTKSREMSSEVKNLNCRVIWSMSESTHDFLSRSLLNPKFVCHLSLLATLFHQLHNYTTSALFVNFNDDGMIDLVAFSKENLILAKTFHTQNPLEESYFIQKTWETLDLDVQSDILIFSGKISHHPESIEMLQKVVAKTHNLSVQLPNEIKINQEEVPTEILYQLCAL